MISIRLVTHVWAADNPQYAQFLRAQLTSLLGFKSSEAAVEITVCNASHEDPEVERALAEFIPLFSGRRGPALRLCQMTTGQLGRRAIGRNWVALRSSQDLIWFTDCDYLFGDGCLEALAVYWRDLCRAEPDRAKRPTLLRPVAYGRHATQEQGDAWLAAQTGYGPVDLPYAEMDSRRKCGKAVGGVQIASGYYCREYGYLNHNWKFQQPVAREDMFANFREDSQFRKHAEKQTFGRAVELPNLFRLRHTAVTYKRKSERI